MTTIVFGMRSALLVIFFFFFLSSHADDNPNGRGPIVYDAQVTMHELDFGRRPAAEREPTPRGLPPESTRSESSVFAPGPQLGFVPPPPAAADRRREQERRERDARRRNWITTSMDGEEAEASPGPGLSEGWGWLAEELGMAERDRELEREERRRMDEEADAMPLSMRNIVESGLIESEFFETPARTSPAALDRSPLAANGENRNAIGREQDISPWQEESSRFGPPTASIDRDLFGGGQRAGSGLSWDLSRDRSVGSSTAGFGQSTSEIGSFGSRTVGGISPATVGQPTRWGSSWEADAGWQQPPPVQRTTPRGLSSTPRPESNFDVNSRGRLSPDPGW